MITRKDLLTSFLLTFDATVMLPLVSVMFTVGVYFEFGVRALLKLQDLDQKRAGS